MGTAFMVTEEAEIHQKVKQAMIKADERSTIHIFRTLGNTARVYKNSVALEVVRMEKRPGGCEFKDIASVEFYFFLLIDHRHGNRECEVC